MRKEWIAWSLISVLLLPLFIGAAAGFVFVDPAAKIQRITMMINQITQSTNQVAQIAQLADQLTELKGQFQHLKDQAMGTVQALTAPFTELASETTGLVSDGMSWRSQFSGVPGDLADAVSDMGSSGTSLTTSWSSWLQQADTVSVGDISDLFSDQTQDLSNRGRDSWEQSRERADKDVVMNQALADAAAELATALQQAKAALEGLQNQSNVSNTALAQAQLAGAVTTGNLAVAQAQMATYKAAKEATQALEDERYRRAMIGAWTTDQRTAQTALQDRLTAIAADGDAWQERTLLRVPAFYTGQYPPTE